jgi:hypothetical protein
MLDGFFLSMDNITTIVGVIVSGIAENFEETTDALFCFFLGFFLLVNRLVAFV